MTREVLLQRAYYAQTAGKYDAAHVSADEPEHDLALSILAGIAAREQFTSFLDVGCGTGRGILYLQSCFPTSKIEGIEPVSELREEALRKGVAKERIIAGEAERISAPDNHYDCVLALGVMHHLRSPRDAIMEMARVARRAVFISDTNNFGCGSIAQRLVAHSLLRARLWKTFQFLKNGFRHYKFTPGDGVHYSYSLLGEIEFLQRIGFRVFLFTTRPSGPSPLWSCSHLAVLGLKSPDADLVP
jgi:ubiquinone/menaquinone biosynthesis C-methylase UbiE